MKKKYYLYKEKFKNTETYGKEKLDPIFITKAEQDFYCDIQNKTKADIISIVWLILEELPDKSSHAVNMEKFNKKCNSHEQQQLVECYYYWKQILKEQQSEFCKNELVNNEWLMPF